MFDWTKLGDDAKLVERRELLLKKALRNRCTNALMTNYRSESGQKFVLNLKEQTGMKITLAEIQPATKKEKKFWSDNGVTLVDKINVISLLPTDKFDFLDFDLCGTLYKSTVEAIEKNLYWKTLFLKVANKFRNKKKEERIIPDSYPQPWVFDWVERNGWHCALEPLPYPRGTKGLWYSNYIITR